MIKRVVRALRHEQIQIAVIVIIRPGAAERSPGVCGHGASENFRESAVAAIVIQEVVLRWLIPNRHEKIGPAVVVIVAPGRAGTVLIVRRDVIGNGRKRAIAVVVEEPIRSKAR